MTPEPNKIELKFPVLIYREDDGWVAHSLHTDTVFWSDQGPVEAAQGLAESMNVLLEDVLCGPGGGALERLKAIFSPAPDWAFAAYGAGTEARKAKRAVREHQPVLRRCKEPVPRVIFNPKQFNQALSFA